MRQRVLAGSSMERMAMFASEPALAELGLLPFVDRQVRRGAKASCTARA